MGYNEKIDVILANFNFKKVAKIMKVLRWEWPEEGVPSVDRLKEVGKDLLGQVSRSRKPEISLACGGFVATKNVVAEWDSSFIE